ncbi:MAG: right-handed parallel beta-helix repeat-containing protein [Pseudonocardiaceae bacterium]
MTLLVLLTTAGSLALPDSSSTATDAATVSGQQGRVFYLSPDGSDSAAGSSPDTAWRSLARASAQRLLPGDHVLLRAGTTFPGTLRLDAQDAGDATAPVVIGSFGAGAATIAALDEPAIVVHNTAGVDVRDLVVVGGAGTRRVRGGISITTDLPGARRLTGVRISGVDVSGFANGIEIGGGPGGSGFRDVRIERTRAHGNLEAGIAIHGPVFTPAAPSYAHERVVVSRVDAYDNTGDPENLGRNTGSGILLGSVRGGRVEWSTAHGNGGRSAAPDGPVGIWTYDSTGVVIEHNVSYGNQTGGSADGDGFGLDQNVSHSVLQYNLSYGNAGAGYLLWMSPPIGAYQDNVVRWNVSSHDSQWSAFYAGITVHGRVRDTQIYHNTVIAGSGTPALRVDAGVTGLETRNNIFVTDGSAPVVVAAKLTPAEASLQGNAYYDATGGTPWFAWGEAAYAGLGPWRSSTGQELLNGAPTGWTADPELIDPSRWPTVVDPTDLSGAAGVMVRPGSPLVAGGLDLRALLGDVGSTDFFGRSLRGVAPSPGADQPTGHGGQR